MAKPTRARTELLVILKGAGCPACHTAITSVRQYLKSVFYEYVNDTEFRNRLRHSLGFCNLHAWQVAHQDLGSSLGFALFYEGVISEILDKQLSGDLSKTRSINLAASGKCPACQAWDDAADAFIALLVREFADREVVAAMQESEGLCLNHLARVLERNEDWQGAEVLLLIHQKKLRGLKEELREFIRKNNYRYLPEGFGKEADSWVRAINWVNGLDKDMNGIT